MSWRVQRGSGELPGRLVVHGSLGSLRRRVWVWTPEGFEAGRPYPLLLFQDGQNLFLRDLSAAGSWRAAEALAAEAAAGRPAVAIGIANAERGRIAEYSPFADRRHGGGGGDAYLTFLREEVLPTVRERLSLPEQPATTGLVGSSLGGLLSLYGVLRHPEAFGLCAALSPSCWFAAPQMCRFVTRAPVGDGRIYLDVGLAERSNQRRDRRTKGLWSRRYAEDVRRIHHLLESRGWPAERLLYLEEPGAGHTEAAWARRLPGALRFLLSPSS